MAVAWGSDTASTQLTSVSTEQFFSQTPQIDPNEYGVCQVVGNSSGTTDSLTVSVYATLDASSENWDTVPIYTFTLDCTDGNDNDVTFVVKDVYKFRVGVQRDGSTDTFTVDMSHRVATMS